MGSGGPWSAGAGSCCLGAGFTWNGIFPTCPEHPITINDTKRALAPSKAMYLRFTRFPFTGEDPGTSSATQYRDHERPLSANYCHAHTAPRQFVRFLSFLVCVFNAHGCVNGDCALRFSSDAPGIAPAAVLPGGLRRRGRIPLRCLLVSNAFRGRRDQAQWVEAKAAAHIQQSMWPLTSSRKLIVQLDRRE